MTADPGIVRKRLRVCGRVQGVWFRDSCRRVAVARGVTGWVRNCEDGSVEAVLEGPAGAVEAVIAWCRVGPSQASVASVESRDESPIGESSFRLG
ncbi:MAG TPA: acylphosphatase [Acidimicrobiales bacterium]|nr:acylphosphatase [Acidimicrobiales bacterium]